MICPEERLVLSRTIKVKGRIIWLNTSTNGKKSIRAEGEPYGSIWAKKSRAWVIKITTIRLTQRTKETEQVK